MSTRGRKHEYSGKCVSLFTALHELPSMKGPDTESTFSVVCSSDILELRNMIERLWHIFRLIWFVQTTDLPLV